MVSAPDRCRLDVRRGPDRDPVTWSSLTTPALRSGSDSWSSA